ncbi:MAG: hypothetical protein Q7U78_14325 [Gallionella sp.]|nr:hypothetical protein [Gallionella sp.]
MDEYTKNRYAARTFEGGLTAYPVPASLHHAFPAASIAHLDRASVSEAFRQVGVK